MTPRKRLVLALLVVLLASAVPASASDYVFTLYVPGGGRLDMYINYSGSGGIIYTVNGLVTGYGKNTPVSGTVVLESPTTARFGLTLLNGLTGWNTVTWEFTCNINTWVCSGNYVSLTAPESRGVLTLSQTPSKPESDPDRMADALKAVGYIK
jgi:hypothetical protein